MAGAQGSQEPNYALCVMRVFPLQGGEYASEEKSVVLCIFCSQFTPALVTVYVVAPTVFFLLCIVVLTPPPP